MEHPQHTSLLRYAEGLLEIADASVVQSHIAECERCRTIVSFEQGLTRAMQELPLSQPSAQFDSGVLGAFRRADSARNTPRVSAVRYFPVALLITVTLVIVIIAGSSGSTQSNSMLTPLFEKITAFLAPVTSTLNTQAERITPVVNEQQGHTLKIFLLASAALLLIGSLDRFIHPRMRHRSRAG